MLKVSVIMPCLNMKKYISDSIKSVVNQTLKDLEIIIVDAGSTDGTLNIIESYKSKDKRIKLIHSDKKSYGYQMNLAVSKAQGEYIGIVETDDYIDLNAYESLYQEISGTNADYIKGKGRAFFNKVDFKYERELNPCLDLQNNKSLTINPSKYPWLFISDNFIWNGLYRREYFKKFPFNETSGAAFQDIGVLFKLISNSSKCIYSNKIVYHYRQDDMLSSSYNHKSLNYVRDEYSALEKSINNLSEGWKYMYYRKMADHTLNRFHFMAAEKVFWTESNDSIDWLHKKLRYAVDNKILSKANFSTDEWEELIIFLKEGAQALFRYCQSEFQKRENITMKTVDNFKDHEWIIFGSGIFGRGLNCIFQMVNIKVKVFCDNSSKKQGTFINGVKVVSPIEAINKYPNAHIMITSKFYRNNIKNQLLKLGVPGERIFAKDISEEIFTNFFTLLALYRKFHKV